MKRIFFVASLVCLPATGMARDCMKVLTANHTKDSQAFQLTEQEVKNSDDIGIEYAKTALSALMKKLKCSEPAVLDDRHSDCAEIVPGNPESEACYLKTNLGYFITNTDYMMNTNIIFNRFD